mmetsp:Transcript_8999/g.17838  ORF Transcript_8999/g.17838 Transcript_8999/m.17838 type:complete len:105 (+) Transcript_8999:203-517(+)
MDRINFSANSHIKCSATKCPDFYCRYRRPQLHTFATHVINLLSPPPPAILSTSFPPLIQTKVGINATRYCDETESHSSPSTSKVINLIRLLDEEYLEAKERYVG